MTNTSNNKTSNDDRGGPNNRDDFEMNVPSKSIVPDTDVRKADGSKKIGNKNALSHGLYSKYVILPGETKSDFEALLEDLFSDWKPNGRSEKEAVFDLAYLTWLKQRLRKYVQLRFQGGSESKSSYDSSRKDEKGLCEDTQTQGQIQNPLKYGQFKDVSDLLARLDAQIDKTLRRLTSLKVFKRDQADLFGPLPQIESSLTVPDASAETELPSQTVKTETDQ